MKVSVNREIGKKALILFAVLAVGPYAMAGDAHAVLDLSADSDTSIGVKVAANRLEARASQDSEIQTNVMEALSAEPVFQTQGVSADVRGGVVHLSGTVSSAVEKDLAARIASRARGTTRVVNQISVSGRSQARTV